MINCRNRFGASEVAAVAKGPNLILASPFDFSRHISYFDRHSKFPLTNRREILRGLIRRRERKYRGERRCDQSVRSILNMTDKVEAAYRERDQTRLAPRSAAVSSSSDARSMRPLAVLPLTISADAVYTPTANATF